MNKRIKRLAKRKAAKGKKAKHAKSRQVSAPSGKEVIVPASPRLFKWNDK